MGVTKQMFVILDRDGKPIAATPFGESAQSYVVENKGTRFVQVTRLKEHSAVFSDRRDGDITDRTVDAAISAKLQGTPLSAFAKSRGVKYEDLRDRVNAKWGYSKPWPSVRPKKKEEGKGKWKGHRTIFGK